MPIREGLLNEKANRYVQAEPDETAIELVNRLQHLGGNEDWHLVVRGQDGKWRAIQIHELLKRLVQRRDLANVPLSQLDLPPAMVVDQNDMSSGEAQDLATRQPNAMLVVTRDLELIGIVYEGKRRSGEANLMEQFVTAGSSRALPTMVESAVPPTEATRSFEAYPDLQAPARVEPESEFNVAVGFRSEADGTLMESRTIRVENVRPGARLEVVLLADGADVIGSAREPLPFDRTARAEFKCRARPNVISIILTAQYFYDSQLVGLGKRFVPVAAPNVFPVPSGPAPRTSLCRLGTASDQTQTDLQATINRTRDGRLNWSFASPHLKGTLGPVTTELADAREFAGGLIADLRTAGFAGLFAARILENVAQDIADIMPHEFFDALVEVHQAVGRTPTVLLYTDEPYVPWELAWVPRRLDPNLPAFLAIQATVGRWLYDEGVIFPPPVDLNVQRISAAAADYTLDSGIRALEHAFDEQKLLVSKHSAVAVHAIRDELESLVEPSLAGHLIHFAVHGISSPQANEEALLLADGSRLVARALSGHYECGGTPPFAFVFLNACQVGTAGSAFGQAAGFPGDLVRGGALGFIAPLWEVDDQTAREIAEAFYEETLLNHRPVGETLRAQRLKYNRKGHTTPMAYIYYGHPNLRLTQGGGTP